MGGAEMEERYKKMSKLGVRNIDGYNARIAEAKTKGETLTRTVHTGYDKETGEAIYEKEELDLEPLPYHRRDRRRNGRPDDGRRQGHRRRDPAPGADGARRRHPRRSWRRSVRRSTSSPAPSRRISRPASPSRSPRRSTAAPFWASRAPSNCSARATCSTWPAAAASAACTDRLSPTTKSRRWCATSRRRASRNISKTSPASDEEDEDGAVFDATGMGGGEGNDLYQQAVAHRAARPQGLDQLHPAPAADRL